MHSKQLLKWFHFYAFLISPDCHLSKMAIGTLHVAGGLSDGEQEKERSVVWTQLGEKKRLILDLHHWRHYQSLHTTLGVCVSVFVCLFISSVRPSESQWNWSHALFHAVNKSHGGTGMNYEKQCKTIDERAKKGRKKRTGDPEEKGRKNSDDNRLSEEDVCYDSASFIFSWRSSTWKRGGGVLVSALQPMNSRVRVSFLISHFLFVLFSSRHSLLHLRLIRIPIPCMLSFVAATLPCSGLLW